MACLNSGNNSLRFFLWDRKINSQELTLLNTTVIRLEIHVIQVDVLQQVINSYQLIFHNGIDNRVVIFLSFCFKLLDIKLHHYFSVSSHEMVLVYPEKQFIGEENRQI